MITQRMKYEVFTAMKIHEAQQMGTNVLKKHTASIFTLKMWLQHLHLQNGCSPSSITFVPIYCTTQRLNTEYCNMVRGNTL
jgi:hypothetical protein